MKTVFILILLLISIGCTRSDEKDGVKDQSLNERSTAQGTLVALVNDTPIYEEDLHKKTLEEAIELELLYQETIRKGVDKKFTGFSDTHKKRKIRRYFRDEVLGKAVKVEEDEINAYYRDHKGNYETILVIELLFEDKTGAEDFKKRTDAGEDFGKLIDEYSKKSAQTKILTRVDPPYGGIFKEKDTGYVADLLSEEQGFKLVMLKERIDIPLESVKRSIDSKIKREKRERLLADYLRKLRQENKVVVIGVGGESKES